MLSANTYTYEEKNETNEPNKTRKKVYSIEKELSEQPSLVLAAGD